MRWDFRVCVLVPSAAGLPSGAATASVGSPQSVRTSTGSVPSSPPSASISAAEVEAKRKADAERAQFEAERRKFEEEKQKMEQMRAQVCVSVCVCRVYTRSVALSSLTVTASVCPVLTTKTDGG